MKMITKMITNIYDMTFTEGKKKGPIISTKVAADNVEDAIEVIKASYKNAVVTQAIIHLSHVMTDDLVDKSAKK
ncbi:MAG: hypothetical protein IMF01_09520 [Proteobacteria bacterium]|nr:hypothetical protein [Pseudomonadota bacterium]